MTIDGQGPYVFLLDTGSRIKAWKLGTAALAPETVAVVDLGKTGGGSVAGLLGSDELSRFGAITIDFRDQQLRLARP